MLDSVFVDELNMKEGEAVSLLGDCGETFNEDAGDSLPPEGEPRALLKVGVWG